MIRVSQLTKTRLEDLSGSLAHRAASSAWLRQKVFNAFRLRRVSVRRIELIREMRFLAYLFAERHRSHAQILQDLWVCFELGGKRDGFFVEFGATDGRTNSNTALLEADYGWRGILAEPNPAWHAALQDNRRADIDLRCVAAQGGETVDFLTVQDPELSTIASYATQRPLRHDPQPCSPDLGGHRHPERPARRASRAARHRLHVDRHRGQRAGHPVRLRLPSLVGSSCSPSSTTTPTESMSSTH